MFREMRREKQGLSREDSERILAESSWGTLAVLGDDGYPYAVPINHVYYDGAVYFHCAQQGHKLDAILACDKVSYSVVEFDASLSQEYASAYRSVVIFGRAHIVEDEAEKIASLRAIGMKRHPERERSDEEVAKSGAHLHMVRIDIEHMSGKQSRELAERKGGLRLNLAKETGLVRPCDDDAFDALDAENEAMFEDGTLC